MDSWSLEGSVSWFDAASVGIRKDRSCILLVNLAVFICGVQDVTGHAAVLVCLASASSHGPTAFGQPAYHWHCSACMLHTIRVADLQTVL